MKMPSKIENVMFAPCGMNCMVCYKHCNSKKPCAGCLSGDMGKPKHCRKCKIKDCAKEKGLSYCYACELFPCKLIKNLEKSCTSRYGVVERHLLGHTFIKKKLSIVLIIIFCITIVSLSFSFFKAESDNEITIVSQELDYKSPESQNVNIAQLEIALNNADNYPGLRSLLIVKNGSLVSENYYAGADENTLQPIHSAAKSLVGILIGIAIEQGYIESVEEPISKYLDSHLEKWPAEKEEIKIKHLLSMTNGLEWNENFYDEFFQSADPVKVALSKPMVAVPGESFNYDVSAFLLSAIIQDTTGMSAYDFAEKNLFKPFEFGEVRWGSHGGYTMGFGDLYMRPRDMAKLGILMMQHGYYDDKQIVDKSWAMDATKPQVATGYGLPSIDIVMEISKVNYGYMHWLGWDGELAFYWAGGLGGQRIICVPEKNLIVVMTAFVPPLSEMGAQDSRKATEQDIALLSFFVKDILPIVD